MKNMESWRKQWFEWVKLVRKKETRRNKKECSHREAMNIASKTWPAQKIKLKKKQDRIVRKNAKEAKLVPVNSDQTPPVEK